MDGGKELHQRQWDGGNEESELIAAIEVNSEGDLILAGQLGLSNFERHLWIAKHEPGGEDLWTWTWTGAFAGYDYLDGVVVGPDDDIHATGAIEPATETMEFWTGGVDTDGNSLWGDSQVGDLDVDARGSELIVNDLGEIIAVGGLAPGAQDNTDMTVLVYDAEYSLTASHEFDEQGAADSAHAIAARVDGGYAISGGTELGGVRVMVFDGDWQLEWEDFFGEPDADVGRALAVDSQNNVIVSGIAIIDGAVHTLVRKYDPAGELLWEHTESEGEAYQVRGMVVDHLDNVIVTGPWTDDGAVDSLARTTKLDPEGEVIWSNDSAAEEGLTTVAFDLAIGIDGTIHVAGMREHADGHMDFWLVGYSP
jgi:hypothetical protein